MERHLSIGDTGAPKFAHVRAEAHATKARHGLGLVLVGYMQLVQGNGNNRAEEVDRGMARAAPARLGYGS
jgi:replicative DNA helicase